MMHYCLLKEPVVGAVEAFLLWAAAIKHSRAEMRANLSWGWCQGTSGV